MTFGADVLARSLVALLRDRRGVAQAELIIALPTLIATLAFVIAVFWLGDTRHRAHAAARACVWDFAIHACDPARTSLCAGATARRGTAVADLGPALGKLLDFPVLGEALMGLVGEPAQAETRARTRVLPGEKRPREVTARHTLVCAPPAESVAERLKNALCDLATTKLSATVYGCDE